ncbi:MAG: hypothetical protein HQK58_17545, partial [Deltaproteobacteria bacterium]|nr:hypothetical protein [Deltaproteobacteria bacterium]
MRCSKTLNIIFELGGQALPGHALDGDLRVRTASSFTGKIVLQVQPLNDLSTGESGDVNLAPEEIPVKTGTSGGEISTKLVVTFHRPEGEYFVVATLVDEQGQQVYRQAHFFHLTGGLLFHGVDIPSTMGAVLLHFSPTPMNHDQLRERMQEHFKERKAIKQQRSGVSEPEPQLPARGAIKKGDNISVEIQWTYTNPLQYGPGNVWTMPVQGARIRIVDTEKNSEVGKNFLSDTGTYSFTAWKDDPKFKIELSTEFGGFSGSNTFTVKRNLTGADTTPKAILFDSLTQTNVSNGAVKYTFPDPNDSHNSALEKITFSAWSVFHGVRDIFKTAKDKLSISIATNTVYFTSYKANGKELGPYTCRTQDNCDFGPAVYLLQADRFDWDVIGHEYGHAVDIENQVSNVLQGGDHDGSSNQYDYAKNAVTLHNKQKSLQMAFDEAFATFFSIAVNQSSSYKGIMARIGDSNYDDYEDDTKTIKLDENDLPYKGEDTERAIHNLLWDVYDSGKETYSLAGIPAEDASSCTLQEMWAKLKGGKYQNISEFWKKNYLTDGDPKNLTKDAAAAAPIFVNFGIGPVLISPKEGTKIDPILSTAPIKFEWKAGLSTMNAALVCDEFILVLYKGDYAGILWQSGKINATSYTLTDKDRQDLVKAMDKDKYKGDIIAVVFGKNDGSKAADGKIETGNYASNSVKLPTINYDKLVVVTMDDSGSNTSTDPKNVRVVAAMQTVNGLTSFREAKARQILPDLAAALTFTDSVSVLHGFDDPEVVQNVFSAASSGSTDIAGAINQAAS